MIRRVLILVAVLLVVLVVAAAVLAYLYNDMLEPVDPAALEDHRSVDIPVGAGAEAIAALLFENGLIRNELVFRYYVRSNSLGPDLMAGRYSFTPAMSLEQIIDKIRRGEVYAETKWFTIPEGYTVEEMAARLEEMGLANGEKFLELTRHPTDRMINNFPFLLEIDQHGTNYKLEGYLFPDTYEVYSDANEEDLVMIMLRRMDQIIAGTFRERINQLELDLHEILTIASLVEREVRVDHERSRVAGIIYNRIAIGQRLEIDATIQYALGETKEFLTYADLEVQSPYNTYRNDGLPPGPIAAPGEASIAAALYPEETEYYFYNYKYDDSGEHFFSRTFQEHLENVRRAEANLR